MPSPTLPQGKTLNNPDELARSFEQLGLYTDPALAELRCLWRQTWQAAAYYWRAMRVWVRTEIAKTTRGISGHAVDPSAVL